MPRPVPIMDKQRLRALLQEAYSGNIDSENCDLGETFGRSQSPLFGSGGTLSESDSKEQRAKGKVIDRSGTRIDGGARFELKDEIDRGGMGIVYRALQPSLKREVAVKTIKRRSEDHGRDCEAFVSEAIVTGLLNHPNIVPVHDLVTTEAGDVAMAMKRIRGTSWRLLLHPSTRAARAAAEGYDLDRHLEILDAVCNAVAYAHSRGILHCDLKPSNVMVGSYGEVVVMDWGMALRFREKDELFSGDAVKLVRHCRSITRPRGTPSYLAPEMARCVPEAFGPWTDVYLLGGILHEILCGRPPHAGQTLYEAVKSAWKSEPPRFEDSVPRELQEICRRALARKVRDRYQSVEEFQAALRAMRIHRESVAICEASDRAVERQEESEGREAYEDLAGAIAGYRQALVLWPENPSAESGEVFARELYARRALEAGDLELARAQAGGLESDEARGLLREIRDAQARRAASARSLKRLRVGVSAAAALILIGLAVGLLLVSQERSRADSNAEEARMQALDALRERSRAERALAVATQREGEARDALTRSEAALAAQRKAQAERDAERAKAEDASSRAEDASDRADEKARLAKAAQKDAKSSLEVARRKAEEAEAAARRAAEAEARALESARVAEQATAARERTLAEVRRFADVELLRHLEERAQQLLEDPGRRLDELEGWINRADALAERAWDHRRALLRAQRKALNATQRAGSDGRGVEKMASWLDRRDAIRNALARGVTPAEKRRLVGESQRLDRKIDGLPGMLRGGKALAFRSEEDRWRYGVLVSLVEGLGRFAEPLKGTLARMKAATAEASKLRQGTDVAFAEEWKSAIRRIARSSRYKNLRLVPQKGLVPLGRDPRSGLQEFLHLDSHRGSIPKRDGKGRLQLGEESGIVFVLLPGERTRVGRRQKNELELESADIRKSELPAHDVELEPFLISKYELTQAQWRRLSGKSPSFYGPESDHEGKAGSLRHPVEMLSWNDCQRLSAVGLGLPTEAQWEYAARGGSDDLWFVGRKERELEGRANLADLAHRRSARKPRKVVEEWDDGFPVHAPVGSFAPNAFGLHDVLGNVAEWCRDGYGSYDLTTREGDGLRTVPDSTKRVVRGGSYRDVAQFARSASRHSLLPTERLSSVGLRPARRLEWKERASIKSSAWKELTKRLGADSRFRRLELEEREDLLPLGPDPKSGLEEFLHLPSHGGNALRRDASGVLQRDEGSGLVFVLVPPGRFTMGTQSEPGGENPDPDAPAGLLPQRVELAAFLVSKYEMTQGQWQRLFGSNPSEFGPDRSFNHHRHDLRHPVESLSFEDCARIQARGLKLPTEAQWEYAARAKGSTPWWNANGREGLASADNLADLSFARMYHKRPSEKWQDDYIMHAPVGLFLANAFGLHDVGGNVREWCRDAYGSYDLAVEDGNGERKAPAGGRRVIRGGSFMSTGAEARVALRHPVAAELRDGYTGLRPVIELP